MNRISALVAGAAIALSAAGGLAQSAGAHRAGCHTAHTCPSDHATYRWRGKFCVSPTSDKRTARFKTRVKYAGRVYWCRR